MDTFREYQHLNELWNQRQSALEGLGMNSTFWQDRPVLVTGATGLVGGWLARRLVEAGADVVCLVRDWVPQSRTRPHRHSIERVKIVRGDICDQRSRSSAPSANMKSTRSFHLAAQTIVGIANRNPVSTFEANIQGTWTARSLPAQPAGEADRRRLLRQGLWRSGNPALRRRHAACKAAIPTMSAKSCADLIAHTYANTYGLPVAITRCGNFYGGGDLTGTASSPAPSARSSAASAPVIRSDGQFVRDYFYVEDGAAAYMLLAEQLAARPELRGQAFNFSNEIQVTVLDLVDRILRHDGLGPGAGRAQRGDQRDPPSVPQRRKGPPDAGLVAAVHARRGLWPRRSPGIKEFFAHDDAEPR